MAYYLLLINRYNFTRVINCFSRNEEAMNDSVKIGEKTFRECVESCEEMAHENNKLAEQMEVLQKENDQLK